MADTLNTTTSKTVLKMLFTVEDGKTVTWTLENPKSNLTYDEVSEFMDAVIDAQGILYNENKATEIKDAYIYETNKIELE